MLPEKYYQVKEVEKMTGISRKILYNWEAVGKIPKPKRQVSSNFRAYSDADIKRIKELIKVK